MRKVRLLETDEIKELGNNVAFGLVDAGKATFDLRQRFSRVVTPKTTKRRYKTRSV